MVITDDNYLDFIDPTVNGEAVSRGLVPRDYATYPVGYLAYAKPFDLPLIPRSEWESRLQAQKDAGAQLSDFRNRGNNGQKIPSRDQNGKGYCATADTEVLTERGWVAYPDYNWSDPIATVNPATHAMEFQTPFERHVYEYDGPMLYSTNRRIDFGVTPDHEMYVRKWDESRRTLSDSYSFVRAGDLGWYSGLLAAPTGCIGTELVELEIPDDRRYDGDDLVMLLGLIVSDGYAGGSESTKNWVSFCCFREEAIESVRALAARTGFKEAPSRPGVFTRYSAGALANWLRENAYADGLVGATHKRVPLVIKASSRRQINLFLQWFNDRSRTGNAYYSSSKALVDDLQELMLRVGKRSTITKRGPRTSTFASNPSGVANSKECYTLVVSDTDRLCIERKKHIEQDRYKGLVYCAGVPNHTLLTRRNGSVLVSSNCWAHSSTSACLLIRALNNQPYADLSAYAVACIIKGYRDEGGWGAESLEWIAQNGIPTSEFWPQQSMSRSNDNPAMRENAKLHRVTEWMDMEPRNVDQLVTCLLQNIPVVIDLNWWAHSVCAMDLVSISPFRIRIWNSWGDSWSEAGTGILEGNRAIPDGMIAPRVLVASDT